MRRLFALIILGSALILTACRKGTTNDQGKQPIERVRTEESDTPDKAAVAEEGTLGKYRVQFGTAQKVKSTYEDADLLMITYTFTNNSTKAVPADLVLTFTAFQDGGEIEQVIDRELTGDSGQRNIRPESSIECKIVFKIISTSDVEVEAKEFLCFDGSKVTKTFTI